MLLKAQDENAEIIEEVLAQLRSKESKGRHRGRDVHSPVLQPGRPGRPRGAQLFPISAALLWPTWISCESSNPVPPKLRVYNPQIQKDGWESTHTVVEIVNDNMPFLVDSVTMEVNRQGLTLHLIIHQVMKTTRDATGGLSEILPREAGRAALQSRSCMSKLTDKPIPKSWLSLRQEFCEFSATCARRLRITRK